MLLKIKSGQSVSNPQSYPSSLYLWDDSSDVRYETNQLINACKTSSIVYFLHLEELLHLLGLPLVQILDSNNS